MEIFYLAVNKLKYIGNCLGKGLVEQLLEAIMNREPAGFLCNLGFQHIIGKLLSLLLLENLRHGLYYKLS